VELQENSERKGDEAKGVALRVLLEGFFEGNLWMLGAVFCLGIWF